MPLTNDSTVLEPPFHRTLRSDSAGTIEGKRSGVGSRPLELRGHERILMFGRCPVGSDAALAERLTAGGRVVAITPRAEVASARRPIDNLEQRASVTVAEAILAEEWSSFDLVLARGLPTVRRDMATIVADLLQAARPGGRIALFEDRFPTLTAWPSVPGLRAAWREYESTLAAHPNGAVGVGLAQWLANAGAVGVRHGLVASGGTAGDPRFEALVDHAIGLLDDARGLPWVRGAGRAIDALATWRVRSDSALMALTRYAEGRKPVAAGFFGLTP